MFTFKQDNEDVLIYKSNILFAKYDTCSQEIKFVDKDTYTDLLTLRAMFGELLYFAKNKMN